MNVSKEFVLEAHKAACNDWRNKIEAEFPELFPSLETLIRELPSYIKFCNQSFGHKSFKFTRQGISIQLPKSNGIWTFAAWELAKDICMGFNYSPIHGKYIEKSDLFENCDDKSEVIVLVKK